MAPPFTATDPNGDQLTYSIVLGTPDSFTIDPATGEVRMGSLDIEEDDVFTATVQVTDGFGEDGYPDPAIDDSLDITMTIVDPNIEVTINDRNHRPKGLWGDGEIFVTANDSGNGQIRFFDADTGEHLSDRDFELNYTRGPRPVGVWSDGDTLYVANQIWTGRTNRVYAYGLDDGNRRRNREITLHQDNDRVGGIWGDGNVLYVTDRTDQKLYAYDIENRSYLAGSSVTLDVQTERGISELGDIWSDGETVWATRWLSNWVRAYNLESGERVPKAGPPDGSGQLRLHRHPLRRVQLLVHRNGQKHHLRIRPATVTTRPSRMTSGRSKRNARNTGAKNPRNEHARTPGLRARRKGPQMERRSLHGRLGGPNSQEVPEPQALPRRQSQPPQENMKK